MNSRIMRYSFRRKATESITEKIYFHIWLDSRVLPKNQKTLKQEFSEWKESMRNISEPER